METSRNDWGKGKVVQQDRVAKLITPDGQLTVVVPQNRKKFTLEEMQKFVGGYIEIVRPPGRSDALLVVDEDGKSKNLPFNPLATKMWQEGCEAGSMRADDPIVGTVLLCHESQVELSESVLWADGP